MSSVNSYKDLIAWQKGMDLVDEIYAITNQLPDKERFGLITQRNRAAVSVCVNIAEGWRRESSKSYIQFLKIARGSLFELETLLLIANKHYKINLAQIEKAFSLQNETSKILNGLIKSIESKLIANGNSLMP